MSQQSNEQEQLEALKHILDRERAARKEAEQKIEVFASDIYEKNQLLQEQTHQAQERQKQLEFLTGLAAETWQQASMTAILDNYLDRSRNFLQFAFATMFELKPDYQLDRVQILPAAETQLMQFEESELRTLFNHLDGFRLSMELTEQAECKLLNLEEYLDPQLGKTYRPEFQFAYIVPLYQNSHNRQTTFGLACFLFEDEANLDIGQLQTIESSRNTLILALSRKQNETNQAKQLAELEQAHQTLKQTQQQLIDSEKLASLGMLSAGVAHEINNPVGYVMSNIDTMHDYLSSLQSVLKPLNENEQLDDAACRTLMAKWQDEEGDYLLEDSQKILNSSIDGLHRIRDIVEALRSFSRMDNHELEAIDVNSTIEHALKMVKNELKYNYQVITDFQADKPIMGSDGQLQQVFINLFINAKHAMKGGGSITIKTWIDKARVKVSVKDTGTGIKEEDLKQIFTPFFTTKKQGEGTGLGLAISYSILQQHHAKIEINTQLGEGTEFLLSFFTFE
ncbi:hypothetical protein HR060_04670 [Catenovulum sp. SM1970]|uniref:sensor histidine kinase n=1 Tax=Marinifaba aquimaris TaxID=2741323 RepID=UPI001572D50F|nr:ATP-binding protein [Marinifaba aquimaris]NTS76155.1 hypothetical protein [Marinifaba aquimaris]